MARLPSLLCALAAVSSAAPLPAQDPQDPELDPLEPRPLQRIWLRQLLEPSPERDERDYRRLADDPSAPADQRALALACAADLGLASGRGGKLAEDLERLAALGSWTADEPPPPRPLGAGLERWRELGRPRRLPPGVHARPCLQRVLARVGTVPPGELAELLAIQQRRLREAEAGGDEEEADSLRLRIRALQLSQGRDRWGLLRRLRKRACEILEFRLAGEDEKADRLEFDVQDRPIARLLGPRFRVDALVREPEKALPEVARRLRARVQGPSNLQERERDTLARTLDRVEKLTEAGRHAEAARLVRPALIFLVPAR